MYSTSNRTLMSLIEKGKERGKRRGGERDMVYYSGFSRETEPTGCVFMCVCTYIYTYMYTYTHI